jgi:hypothetical protein
MNMTLDKKYLAASLGLFAGGAVIAAFDAAPTEPSPPAKVANFDPKDLPTDPKLGQESFNAHCAEIAAKAHQDGKVEGLVLAAGACLMCSIASPLVNGLRTKHSSGLP